MITPASFKIRFPEFACNPSNQIQIFIDDAALILNEAYWGAKYDLALYYLTAHFLSSAIQTGAGNNEISSLIASKSVDGTSISFSVPAIKDQDEAYYLSTSYGQRYLQLRSKLGIAAYVV